MKRIFICLLASAYILAGCTEVASHQETDNHEKYSNSSREIYRAIETGDVSKLDSFLAVDIVDHEGDMYGNPVRGRDSVKAMIADIHNHFDSLNIEVISNATSADGQYHYSLVRFMGRAKDSTMGMPAGTSVNSVVVDVVRMQNGLAVEHWGFRQPAEMMKMMQHGTFGKDSTTLRDTAMKRDTGRMY